MINQIISIICNDESFDNCKGGKIDKISFNIPRSLISNHYYTAIDKERITINKQGEYYFRIHFHDGFFVKGMHIIVQLYTGFLELYLKNIFKIPDVASLIKLMNETLKIAEIEIAFDMPKSRLNFNEIKQVFIPYKNTYYSNDFSNRNKKSRISIYNRDLKLKNPVINRTPIYRLEFRLMPSDLEKIVPNGNRNLLNCAFLYQSPNDFVKNFSHPLYILRKELSIPRKIIKTYRDQILLSEIFS